MATLKKRFLDSSNTSSPAEPILISFDNDIGPVLAQVIELLEGSLKKSLDNFSVIGLHISGEAITYRHSVQER